MTRAASTTPVAFRGFPDSRGDFFLALALHNDRDWFQSHRAEYEQGWAEPMAALLGEVRDGLRGAYGRRGLGDPKVFRIHRDVRFSKDKTPCKTHVAGWIPLETGRPASPGATPAAMYLQVGVDARFTGSGCWTLEPDALKRFRAALLDPRRGATKSTSQHAKRTACRWTMARTCAAPEITLGPQGVANPATIPTAATTAIVV
jgi:uncharacterized protein (TIGR02453 family)